VRHVQSGNIAYFTDVEGLLTFLAIHGSQAFIRKGEANQNPLASPQA